MKFRPIFLLFGTCLTLAACGDPKPYQLNSNESLTAETGARRFAERDGADFVSCSGQDSPPIDGYVTCTTKDKVTRANKEIVCAYRDGAVGCKLK